MKNVKGVDNLLLSASYSNLNEDVDVYMVDPNTGKIKYYYNYVELWKTADGSFTWNDGTSRFTSYEGV